jgi:hypothetical protein
MADMKEIEALAASYRQAHDAFDDALRAFERDVAAVRAEHRATLRRSLTTAANRLEKLETAIGESRHLFQKPRTTVVDGVKLGLQKGKDTLAWDNETVLIKRIETLFPDDIDLYVKTVQTPLKTPLAQLDDVTKRRLGVRVEPGADAVLVKLLDGDIEKMIRKIVDRDADDEAA